MRETPQGLELNAVHGSFNEVLIKDFRIEIEPSRIVRQSMR